MTGILHVAPGPIMSQATIFHGIAFLAGQVAGARPFADFETEVRAVLANVDLALAAAGSDRARLLHVTVHIADIALMPRLNPVWQDWLAGATPPARVAVQTPMVDSRFSVAMTCIAAVRPAEGPG